MVSLIRWHVEMSRIIKSFSGGMYIRKNRWLQHNCKSQKLVVILVLLKRKPVTYAANMIHCYLKILCCWISPLNLIHIPLLGLSRKSYLYIDYLVYNCINYNAMNWMLSSLRNFALAVWCFYVWIWNLMKNFLLVNHKYFEESLLHSQIQYSDIHVLFHLVDNTH